MTDGGAEKQVTVLAALAQPTRLQILSRLAEAGAKGISAGDLARSIRCPASTLSFHLKELSRTGVLEARPRGRFIIYVVQRKALEDLACYISGLIGEEPAMKPRRRGAAKGGRQSKTSSREQLSMFGD